MYGYYITQAGANLMAQALIQNSSVTISQCAVGDGGDSEAEKDLNRTALNNETYRKSFDIEDSYSLSPNDGDTLMIECVIPSDAGELTVSEIGFFDDTDTLIAYGTLKEQKLNTAGDGLDYSLDIVSFIELTSEQLSVLKVDLGKANVQAISERVDEFENTVNSTVDTFKNDVNSTVNTFKGDVHNTVDQYKTDLDNSWNEHVTEYETKVDGKIKGIEDTLESLNLSGDMKEKLDALEKRVDQYHPNVSPDSYKIKSGMLPIDENTTAIITTDQVAPKNKSTTDLSQAEDGSVVGWVDGTTYYVSTQVNGAKIRVIDGDEIFSGYERNEFVDGSDGPIPVNHSNVHTIDISNVDFSECTSLRGIFAGNEKLENLIGYERIDTSKVKNFGSVFSSCEKLTAIDVSKWDTSQATTLSGMFNECQEVTELDVSNFITRNVTSLSYTFNSCKKITTLDLSNWDISKVTSTNYMFGYCTDLTTIYAKDWTTNTEIENESSMFSNCDSLPGYVNEYRDGKYAKPSVDGGYFTIKRNADTRLDELEKRMNKYHPEGSEGSENPESPENYERVKLKAEYIINGLGVDELGDIKVAFTDAKPLSNYSRDVIDCSENGDGSVVKWYMNRTIYVSSQKPGTKIEVPIYYEVDNINGNEKHRASIYTDMTIEDRSTTTGNIDYENITSRITEIDFSNACVAKNSSLNRMFYRCSKLKSVDLTPLGDCHPTDFSYMFYECSELKSIDLSPFGNCRPTSIEYMFFGCIKLVLINLKDIDVSLVENAKYTFDGCSKLTCIYSNNDWTSNEVIKKEVDLFDDYSTNLPNYDYRTNGYYATFTYKGGYFTKFPSTDNRIESLETDLVGVAKFLESRI